MYIKKQKTYQAYVSNYNSNREKQVILLMILNREIREPKSEGWQQWHYLAVKELPALLRGITSKNSDDFYCLNCLYSFRTKSKLESRKRACRNKDFCNVKMPSKKLDFNQYQKSIKA